MFNVHDAKQEPLDSETTKDPSGDWEKSQKVRGPRVANLSDFSDPTSSIENM